MQNFADLSCRKFIDELAGKSPTPGGGSTSALVGALGMALGNMVVNLTLGKPRYADAQEELETLHIQSKAIQDTLVELVQKDVQAFEPLAAAYVLPSATPQEQRQKQLRMEVCLKAAAEVPINIMKQCCMAIDLHERYKDLGSKLAISDVGVGVALCLAALRGASLNVYINTNMMADKEYAQKLGAQADKMLDLGTKKAEIIFQSVLEMLK